MKTFKCVCCGFEIKPIDSKYVDLEHGMWDGGTVEKIYMPYGSLLDGDIYILGICDDCIIKKTEEGTIIKL